jgi:fructose-specific phosphotransferase system IIC component
MDLGALISSPFFVGGMGALVSLRFVEGVGWWRRVTTLVCGALIAGYFAQPLGDWLKLTKSSDVLGVAFALGLLGLSIISAALRAIAELKLAEIITGWIGRRG